MSETVASRTADASTDRLPIRFDGIPTISRTATARDLSTPVRRLVAELEANTQAEVRFDDGSRTAYSTDGSNYRQVPIGVVVPRTFDDVIDTVSLCHRFELPITTRGGGTSLAGQTTNEAVIIDFSKYLNAVESIERRRPPGSSPDAISTICVRTPRNTG